ncbi:MAG TPA: DUF2076 domain-containing protein [Pseudolabrys sp.]|nr:DUF2076 domain-containing protein [Pseudolabrys sp.]
MTPQEHQLIADLFDRLARLEAAPRDAEAERAIADGLSRAPNAAYALVQTVLVQDEALKRADQRIRELTGEDEPAPQGGGFLDSMREAVFGRSAASVPSVRQGAPNEPDSRWNRGGTYGGTSGYPNDPYANAPPQASPWQSGGGSSFLGNAAASAVGAIGGALLFNSISSMFGGHRSSGSAFGDASSGGFGSGTPSPWDNSAAGSDLARDAGLNDIGRGSGPDPRQAGFFGDMDQNDIADAGPDFGNDFGGDFGGDDSDNA